MGGPISPGYTRGVVRPRVFWDDGQRPNVLRDRGTTWEDRTGGTEPGRCWPPRVRPYVEALETRRVDAGALGQATRRRAATSSRCGRASCAPASRPPVRRDAGTRSPRHGVRRGGDSRRERRQTWVAGWRSSATPTARRICRSSTTPSRRPVSSLQDDVDVRRWLSLSVSGRLDHHSRVRHVLQPARLGARAVRAVDEPRVGGHGLLRAHRRSRKKPRRPGSRGWRFHEPLRGRTRAQHVVRRHADDGPLSFTVTAVPTRASRTRMSVDRTAFTLANQTDPTTNAGVEVLGHVAAGAVRAHGAPTRTCARARPSDTGRLDVAADAASQRGPRRHVGVGGRGPRRRRVVLHRPAAARSQPVPRRPASRT